MRKSRFGESNLKYATKLERKQCVHFSPSGGHLNYSNSIALGDAARAQAVRIAEFEAQHGTGKTIAKYGYWLVPPQDRPKKWESMGLKEGRPCPNCPRLIPGEFSLCMYCQRALDNQQKGS